MIVGLGLQFFLTRWWGNQPARRPWVLAASAFGAMLLVAGHLLEYETIVQLVPGTVVLVVQFVHLLWFAGLLAAFFASLTWRTSRKFRPDRRVFLERTAAAICVAPVVGFGIGYVNRDKFRVVETEIPIAHLPKELQGLRIAQVTDIHLSQFLSERELARIVDMTNEQKAHITLVTGDLITRPGDPLDACLRQLGRLRAEGGIFGCLGNHEIYTGTEDYVTEAGRKIGIEFLRHEARLLPFGEARLNLVGVDYQRMHSKYLLGVESLTQLDAVNVLLSHNPDVFPVAASQGFDLTISGHTHGGQINFEVLDQNVNIARYFTPYTRGLYRDLDSSIYVSSGIGTIGLPVRIGAPPEISVLRLCAT